MNIIYLITINLLFIPTSFGEPKEYNCPYNLGKKDKDAKELLSNAKNLLTAIAKEAESCSGSLASKIGSNAGQIPGNIQMPGMPSLGDNPFGAALNLGLGNKSLDMLVDCETFDIVYKYEYDSMMRAIERDNSFMAPADYVKCYSFPPVTGGFSFLTENLDLEEDVEKCMINVYSTKMIEKDKECKTTSDIKKIQAKRKEAIKAINTTAQSIASAISSLADDPKCAGMAKGSVKKLLSLGSSLTQTASAYTSSFNPIMGAGIGAISTIADSVIKLFTNKNPAQDAINEISAREDWQERMCILNEFQTKLTGCDLEKEKQALNRLASKGFCKHPDDTYNLDNVAEIEKIASSFPTAYESLAPYKLKIEEAKTIEEKKLAQELYDNKLKELRSGLVDRFDTVSTMFNSQIAYPSEDGSKNQKTIESFIVDSISKYREILKKDTIWLAEHGIPSKRSLASKVNNMERFIGYQKEYRELVGSFNSGAIDESTMINADQKYAELLEAVSLNEKDNSLGSVLNFISSADSLLDKDSPMVRLQKNILENNLRRANTARINAYETAVNSTNLGHSAQTLDMAHNGLVGSLKGKYEAFLKDDLESFKNSFFVANNTIERGKAFDRLVLPLIKHCTTGASLAFLNPKKQDDNYTGMNIQIPSKNSDFNKACSMFVCKGGIEAFDKSQYCNKLFGIGRNLDSCEASNFRKYQCNLNSDAINYAKNFKNEFLKKGTICNKSAKDLKNFDNNDKFNKSPNYDYSISKGLKASENGNKICEEESSNTFKCADSLYLSKKNPNILRDTKERGYAIKFKKNKLIFHHNDITLLSKKNHYIKLNDYEISEKLKEEYKFTLGKTNSPSMTDVNITNACSGYFLESDKAKEELERSNSTSK